MAKPATLGKLTKLRDDLRDFTLYKAALQCYRWVYYEHGDKCGGTLARALRTQQVRTYIREIITRAGSKTAEIH